MTRDHGLQTCPTIFPTRATGGRAVLPLLIQVPALSGPGWARPMGRSSRRGPMRTMKRRRLRREVRIAGSALLTAAPLVLAALLFWVGTPAASSPPDREPVAVDRLPARPPAISLSIEPAAIVPYAEVEPPVVFPGYLLPADDSEGPAHAGS